MFLAATDTTVKKDFEPHAKGPCKGVCTEVITKNKKTGEPFSKTSLEGDTKHQMILVFQTDKTIETEEGNEHCVHWEWFNIPKSLDNENSKLHKFLNNWEVPIQDYETEDAFAEAVVGKPAHLVFTHNKSDNGKTYSNLTSCTAVDDPADAWVAKDYKAYNVVPF